MGTDKYQAPPVDPVQEVAKQIYQTYVAGVFAEAVNVEQATTQINGIAEIIKAALFPKQTEKAVELVQ